MIRPKRFIRFVCLACTVLGPGAADAQDSRAGEIAAAQERKSHELTAPSAGFIERRLIKIERGEIGVGGVLSVAFGDIKRGTGPSMGPAYAKTLSGGTIVRAKAVYSITNAKLVQVSLQAPPLARDRLLLRTRARWQDVPKVPFHGIAPGVPGVGARYSETVSEVSATAEFTPTRLLRFGGGLGIESFDTGIASSSKPEFDFLFVGAPGVGADPRYVHSQLSAAIDSRDSEGYTRHGSLLRATLHDYRQQNDGRYSFRQFDGVAEQYVPILRGNWVIYLGLRASTTMTEPENSVPFFLLPDLGGHDIRGFDTYRFRDRHSVQATAEYRWYAQEFLDGALFYDAGKAVPTRSELDFNDLEHSYGAGIRLHGPRTTLLRLEVARSREGTRLIFSFSPVGG
jgi:hypothetical protein